MKHVLFLIILTTQFSTFAQTKEVFGVYAKTIETRSESITFQLSLNKNGNFLFEYSKNIHCASCPQKFKKARGTWKEKKSLIHFYANKDKDLIDEFVLDFTKAKATIINKNNSTKLIFTKSKIDYLKDLQLLKKQQ